MKRKFILMAIVTVLGCCAMPMWAQTATVSGTVIDAAGKPIKGAIVELVSTSTGRKYPLKTNDKGQYFSIGVASGTYDVNVTKDGKLVDSAKNFTVSLSQEQNVLDFDLAKSQAAAEANLGGAEKARREAAAKESQKIQGLNSMLTAARAAAQAGNYDEAVRVMTQATQIDATHDLLWAQLGDAYLGAGRHTQDKAAAHDDYQQAVSAYKKAIAIKPVGAYYNNLGEAYAKLGQTEDAIPQYQLAAQKDPPGAARYYFNLGAILTNTGHTDEANNAFDKVIAANPDFAEAYYQKAVNLLGKATVDEKTGVMKAPPEVASDLNKYLDLTPTGPNAESAKALLASLGEKIETSYGSKTKKK